MSRPTKQGIDYFPVDVQFDNQLELLIADKGGISLAIIVTIWQLIYQNNGYYIENGNDLALLVKRRIMIDQEIISEIITAAINRGIFDKKLHKKYKILTSKGIQKRYVVAARLKKNINIVKNYLLIGVSNVGNYTYIGINGVENATKEEEEVEVDIYTLFLTEWNKNKIIIHKKLLSGTDTAIRKALNDYTQDEIFKAFENYKTILSSDNYYWSFKWGLKEFLNRGVQKFVDSAEPFGNYEINNKTPFTSAPEDDPNSYENTMKRQNEQERINLEKEAARQ